VRASGRVTHKAGLIDLVCHPGSYTNPYTVEKPFTRDLGSTVILGGWVRISGTAHWIAEENPVELLDALLAFVR